METGIDIVKISRIKLTEAFINKILTEKEKEEYLLIKSDKRRKEFLAGHFAFKEAVFKATGDKHYLSYSLLHEESGKPYADNHPEIKVSVTHDGDYAVCIVIVD